MPPTPLRALLVEDSPTDAALVLRELAGGGFGVDSVRVDTEPAFLAAIEEQAWDVILSDFSMPEFNGMVAFEMLGEKGLDIPFIFVSGRIGEDRAAEAMRLGAKDYILKDNLKRLVPAVLRELKEADERRKRQALADALRSSDEKLRDNERLLQTVFDTLPLRLVVKDNESRYVKVNRAWCERFGLSPGQVIGKKSGEISGRVDEDRQVTLEQDRQTLASDGKILEFNGWDTTPAGERRYSQSFRAPLRDESGKVTGLVGATVDRTELKRAEQALRQNNEELESANDQLRVAHLALEAEVAERTPAEQRFRQLVELAPQAMVAVDREGKIVFVNAEAQTYFGYAQDELIGQPIEMLIPERFRAQHPAQVKEFFKAPTLRTLRPAFELHGLRKDGSEFPADIRLGPMQTAGGLQVIASITDISAFKEAEAKLLASQHLLQTVFDTIPHMLVVKDVKSRFLMVNKAWSESFGISPEAIKNVATLGVPEFPEAEKRAYLEEDRKVFAGKRTFEASERLITVKGGRQLTVHSYKSPLYDDSGTVVGLVGVFVDVSERMQAERKLRESEEKFRNLVQGSIQGVSVIQDFKLVFANQAYARLHGFSDVDELMAAGDWLDRIVPENRDRMKALHGARKAGTAGPLRYEREGVCQDGTRIWLDVSTTVFEWEGASAWLATMVDITERKRAEGEVRASQRLLQTVFDTLPVTLAVKDADSRYRMVNRAWCELYGVTPEQMIGIHTLGVPGRLEPEQLSSLEQDRKALAAGGTPVVFQRWTQTSAGELRYFHGIKAAIRDEQGQAIGLVAATVDFTEQKRAEQALEASQRLLQTVFDTIPHILIVKDTQCRYLMVNKAWTKTFGISQEDTVNKHTLDIPSRPAGELRAYFEEDQRVIAGHGSSVFEERSVVVKPGDTRWFNSIKTALKDDNGAIIGLVGVMIDLTAVKKAQSSADLAHARLVDAIESLPAAFFLYDADERLVLWNSRVRDFYPDLYAAVRPGMRFEQALRTVMESVNTGEESRDERMRERLAQFRESPGSLEQQMVDGRWLQILDRRTSDGGTVCLRFDVTEAKRQDEARRQSQKLEAIGSLAGGISHDFNNLLTVINSHAEFIVEAAGGQGQLRDDAQMILESGVRAAALTRQLLAFSRKQVLQMQVLDINAVVGNLEKMLRRLIGEDIELGSQLASRLATIRADPTQIEQIVINLTVNSRDAMPKGGKLFIETANRNIDATYCETHPEIKPGDYVMLAVSDNGHGMDQATQARVFEPFFTTKPLGKGTGMGLATVYGIVKQMGGSIFVYSEVGKGTTFKIYFPLYSDSAVAVAVHGTAASPAKGTETVLLVEDEDLVRKSAARILLGEGYTVLVATGPDEAIKLVASHGTSIDLLLSDVVMPGLSGRELWDRIRKTLPIRVLFMSGYTDDAIVRHGILEGSVPFLSKPFNKLSLLNKVREVLDNPIPDGTFAP